jgi:hypothetical protein
MEFWAILAGMIAVCLVIFAAFYQGLGKRPAAA